MKEKKPSAFKGVTYDKSRDKYYARIAFSGVRYALGRYKTYEEALSVYEKAWNMGAVRLKAWYNLEPQYRGNLGDAFSGVSIYPEEENKIRAYKSIRDGAFEEDKEYAQW